MGSVAHFWAHGCGDPFLALTKSGSLTLGALLLNDATRQAINQGLLSLH